MVSYSVFMVILSYFYWKETCRVENGRIDLIGNSDTLTIIDYVPRTGQFTLSNEAIMQTHKLLDLTIIIREKFKVNFNANDSTGNSILDYHEPLSFHGYSFGYRDSSYNYSTKKGNGKFQEFTNFKNTE